MAGFTPKDWVDGTNHETAGSSTTKISAAALEDLETRVTDYTDLLTGGVFNVKDYGATGGGVSDDTDEILAAVAACDAAGGGIVFLPTGIYQFSDVIEIPQGVTLQGSGSCGWEGTDGSILRATAADAQVYFTASKSINQGFRINGNTIATNPMRVGETFASTFIGIVVDRAVEDNCILYGTQQPTMYSCDFGHAGRDALVLDGGTQSGLFSRIDCGGNIGRHGIRLGPVAGAAGGVYYHRFDMCLVEQQAGSTDDPLVKCENYAGASGTVVFNQLQVVGAAGSATSAIEITETEAYSIGQIIFEDLAMIGEGANGLFADIQGGPVILRGRTFWGAYGGTDSGAVKAAHANTLVLMGELAAGGSASPPIIDATSALVQIDGARAIYPALEYSGFDPDLVSDYSLFLDGDTGKLSYKDATHTVNALY